MFLFDYLGSCKSKLKELRAFSSSINACARFGRSLRVPFDSLGQPLGTRG